MTEGEMLSAVLRLIALILAAGTMALLSWWHMLGPAWALTGVVALTLLSVGVDLGRHVR